MPNTPACLGLVDKVGCVVPDVGGKGGVNSPRRRRRVSGEAWFGAWTGQPVADAVRVKPRNAAPGSAGRRFPGAELAGVFVQDIVGAVGDGGSVR